MWHQQCKVAFNPWDWERNDNALLDSAPLDCTAANDCMLCTESSLGFQVAVAETCKFDVGETTIVVVYTCINWLRYNVVISQAASFVTA